MSIPYLRSWYDFHVPCTCCWTDCDCGCVEDCKRHWTLSHIKEEA